MMNQESRKWIFISTRTAFGAGLAAWGIRGILSRFKKEREEMLLALAENSQIIQTAKGPLEVSISGNGPPVLAVHGAAGGYDQGKIKSEEFTGVTYISVSRPGYLRTPLSTGPAPAEQADALAALLDVLQVDKTVLIGTSTGGLVGLYFALRHPQRCQALVLISTVNAPLPVHVSPLAVFSPLLTGDFLS